MNYNRNWIIENTLDEIEDYEKGILTIRGLHYRLVSRGMPNTFNQYKMVVNAMIAARWNGDVPFDTFSDNDREMIGQTEADKTIYTAKLKKAQIQVEAWMDSYHMNIWENQNVYPEVWIEKKALQGVFQSVCDEKSVGLAACKGYPSLTFIYEAAKRFEQVSSDKDIIILYFGDYDPSGEDIPRSINDNLKAMGVNVYVERCLLLHEQVLDWDLPPAPVKSGDSRSKNWSGIGQVELDAIDPHELQRHCAEAIDRHFDTDLYSELLITEDQDRKAFHNDMKEFVRRMDL